MKKTLFILRAYSWPASTVAVIVGSVLAARSGVFSWLDFALTFVAALCVHSGANLANTYYDFKNGIDKPESSDDRALVDNLLPPSAVFRPAVVLFAAAAAIGVFLSFKNRLPLLPAAGAAGFLLAWFYTAGSVGYKYRALGDLGIFLAFGPLIVVGTAYIQTGRFLAPALLASVPVGLLIVAILHANNMRDISSDGAAEIKTLAGALGLERSKTFYRTLLLVSYAFTLVHNSVWPPAFAALSLPLALKLDALSAGNDFFKLVGETAKFVAVFGLLFSAGLWI